MCNKKNLPFFCVKNGLLDPLATHLFLAPKGVHGVGYCSKQSCKWVKVVGWDYTVISWDWGNSIIIPIPNPWHLGQLGNDLHWYDLIKWKSLCCESCFCHNYRVVRSCVVLWSWMKTSWKFHRMLLYPIIRSYLVHL